MILAFLLYSLLVLGPVAVVFFINPSLRAPIGVLLPAAIALSLFLFHTLSACTYGISINAASHLALIFVATTLVVAWVLRVFGPRLIDTLKPGPSARALTLIAVMACVPILTDAWIFNLQGFDFEDRTSRFAAPFRGDHWRHMAIISGLVRNNDAIFFPDAQLVYQILWHHGAARVVALLPARSTLFHYELGLALSAGILFYFFAFWLACFLRSELARWVAGLLLLVVLAGTDADIFHVAGSVLHKTDIGIAADSSSTISSPFRYFSTKLISLTAPQHALFFVFLAMLLAALVRAREYWYVHDPRARPAIALAGVFAIPAVLFSPILSLLLLPLLYGAGLMGAARRRQALFDLLITGLAAVAAAIILHFAILRLPMWELFLRPNITGGGSGAYGFVVLPLLRGDSVYLANLPISLSIMTGFTGLLVTLLLLRGAFMERGMFGDLIVISYILGVVVWNLIIVDTEIQRHQSMIAAVLGLWLIAAHVPCSWPRLVVSIAVVATAVLCIGLNGFLIRAYTRNAAFMPLTSAWTDYFCMNDIVRKRHSKIAAIVRTPEHFELPISVEAMTSLVWSQVASVHQRISASTANQFDQLNPRDWVTFRNHAEQDGPNFVDTLRRMGFDAVIWGPLEDQGYGPRMHDLLIKPENFLASCGAVALYRLDWSSVPALADAAERHSAHILAQSVRPDILFSSVPGVQVHVAERMASNDALLHDVANNAAASQSSTIPGADAKYAVDGLWQPASPVAMTTNEFTPWWQVDLDQSRYVDALRVTTLEEPRYSQYELRDFYILVSEQPFTSSTLFKAGISPGVTSYFVPGRITGTVLFRIGRPVRYIRLQRTDQGHLVLREVEALGREHLD
jgi:hypothetical protein